ncbi:alpha/beta fold hydrolase [Vibrio sp. RC27]
MPVFVVNGKSMHYQDIGQGDVIVFGHDYLWDCEMWREQVAELSQSYRCIIPDFFGHGLSDPLPYSGFDLTDYAKHVLALLDSLDIKDFSLAGLSLGGMWSVELTMLVPQRVKSLVLLNTFVGFEPEVNCTKYNDWFHRMKQESQISDEVITPLLPLYFSTYALEQSEGYVAEFENKLKNATELQIHSWVDVGKVMYSRPERFEDIEKFALPVLIISGSEDRARPPLESYLMNDAITGSELKVLANTGHMSVLESSAEVTSHLNAFFAHNLG